MLSNRVKSYVHVSYCFSQVQVVVCHLKCISKLAFCPYQTSLMKVKTKIDFIRCSSLFANKAYLLASTRLKISITFKNEVQVV